MQLAISKQPDRLDKKIRIRLIESLEYIFDQCGDRLKISAENRSQLKKRINRNRIHPGIFARYYDLVFSINAKNFNQAQKLIDEIISLSNRNVNFDIFPYSREVLSEDYERFPRLAFSAYSENNPMAPLNKQLFELQKANLIEAKQIISEYDLGINKEINELVSQIIVCKDNSNSDSVRVFAGASSLMIWGAIIVNVNQYKSLYQLVEFLVHESTHCVLFGLSINNPLVLNAVDELYTSPLRSDPRPMDGIYHATIVCARIALFMRKWEASAIHSNLQSQWMSIQIQENIKAFKNGSKTINQHGKLSEEGIEIIEKFDTLISKI